MASSREYLLEDEDWKEVEIINSYAVLMGYLSMAIKGLGFLVLTWTTVVLLGGFVSSLHRKDFWSLTFITLVQMAGIFDAVLNEKLRYILNAAYLLIVGGFLGMVGDSDEINSILSILLAIVRFLLGLVLTLVQIVVLPAVLFPLVIIYVFGILISGGISLWRLIEHDYSDLEGDASNLLPAINTLYYLALFQAVLFCYRIGMGRAGKMVVKEGLPLIGRFERQVLSKYLRETMNACDKDPSFAKGRNLTTRAVDLICSSSPVDCVAGVEMLCAAIYIVESQKKRKYVSDFSRSPANIHCGQLMLMEHLIVSASSSKKVLRKLLETLDSVGLHDRVTRTRAAKIVVCLASKINLVVFPTGIQHISSMLETFEQYSIAQPYELDLRYNQQHWALNGRSLVLLPADGDDAHGDLTDSYKVLLLQGLRILRALAADENNCRVMSETRDLVSKIMAPVTSDLLDHTTDDHGGWYDVVELSMEVMSRLTISPGEIGAKLRGEISKCEKSIRTLWRILSCKKCKEELHLRAIRILTRLYVDPETSRTTDFVLKKESSNNSSREDFVLKLVEILTDVNNYSSSIRGYAGGALSEICFNGGISDARIVMQTRGGDAIDSLTKVLVHDKDETCRQAAAEIFQHLCTHYTKDDEYLTKLKKAVLEVIGELLCCGDETNKEKEADQVLFAKPKADIESQCDSGRSKGISPSSSSQPKKEKAPKAAVQSVKSTTLWSSLLSLCSTMYDTDIISDLLPPSFVNKRTEMVVNKSDRKVENLLLFKAIAKMVISMIEHSGGKYFKEDFESLIEALSSASKEMLNVDYSMVFSSSRCDTTSSKLHSHTLVSLVKEAQELHARLPSTSVSG